MHMKLSQPFKHTGGHMVGWPVAVWPGGRVGGGGGSTVAAKPAPHSETFVQGKTLGHHHIT